MRVPSRELAAYHEAGHAVIAHVLGAQVRRVTIADDSGSTQIRRLGHGERAILVNLAGPYAQKHYAPRSRWRSRSHTGFNSGYDFDNVTNLIFHMHGTGKVAETYWRYMEAKAQALIEEHWQRIEAVAKVLLDRGVISGDIRFALPRPRASQKGTKMKVS
jgi:hypothetical protein